jgi:hypothetical protein
VTSPNPLVAQRSGTVGAWDGVWIAEDLGDVVTGVRSGNWIDTSIGGFAASMDALAFVTDPLGTLVSWGVAWLMEHVKPLRDALDRLAGDPAQITAYAQTWHNVAASMRQAGTDLAAAVGRDLTGWTGAAGDAYRGRAGSQAAALGAIGAAAEAIGVIVEGAGLVVALVRQLVRDLIAEFVSILAMRLWEWLAEEAGTLGIGTPWVIAQVSTLVAKWAVKITRLLHGLAATLRRLAGKIGELGKLIESLKKMLRDLMRRGHEDPRGGAGGPMLASSTEPGASSEPPVGVNDHSVDSDSGDVLVQPDGPRGAPDFSTPELDDRKITDYAMNPNHPVGKNKYRVINSATGLGPDDAQEIRRQIIEGVHDGTPIRGKVDEYGQRWSVDVPLTGPHGTMIVRTAWILDSGSTTPRMVTISFPPEKG